MSHQTSLIQALSLVNNAILQRQDNGSFKVLYAPHWLSLLIPESADQPAFHYSNSCEFLSDFLLDAETFWQTGESGEIFSGIWSEQRGEQLLHLEASAAVMQQHCYLLIHNIRHQFQRQQQTLQLAREALLHNDRIVAEHDYVFHRLESILLDSAIKKNVLSDFQHNLNQSDLGVAILDDKLSQLSSNKTLQQIFKVPLKKPKSSAVSLLLNLFEHQYPEYHRVFSTGSSWSGELYWLNPPHQGRWFKVSLHPISDSAQQKRFWLMSVSDITQMKFLLKRNEHLSHFDGMTDLANRAYFWQQLNRYIDKGQRFFLLYMEIKQLKKINERHGHQVGDAVIKALAERLKAAISRDDLLARTGGTEFALLVTLPATLQHRPEQQQQYCQRLADELIQAAVEPFITANGEQCEVGLNIGVACFADDADNAEDLMRYADMAVFAAKKHLKSTLVFYSTELHEASRQRIELEAALRQALHNHQFELYFQPIFALNNLKMIKAEVLLRWHHPLNGMIAPDRFIPLAEQTGLIVPIGKWVLQQTCEALARLQNAGLNIGLSVNLSPRQVGDQHLFEFIRQTIAQADVSARQLELELTEGVLADNLQKTQTLLNQVRELGIGVSIDDFGTGYSSLRYLQTLPIDRLKIDRSFVRDISENENAQALVLAVIAMAQSLKLEVIAEGVETEQQKAFLQSHQCQAAQGFLFSHPVPFNELLVLLSADFPPTAN